MGDFLSGAVNRSRPSTIHKFARHNRLARDGMSPSNVFIGTVIYKNANQ